MTIAKILNHMEYRDRLKQLSGTTQTFHAFYSHKDKYTSHKHLLKDIQDEHGNNICNHLWISSKKIKAWKGDTVVFTGEIVKYAKFSYREKLQENYGIDNVRCSVIKKRMVHD